MEPCHPTRVSLTVVACSQWTLKRANSNCLRTLTLTQWRRMWFVNSSSYLQKKKIIDQRPLSFLKLIHCQHLSQTSLPCKKTSFRKHPRVPSYSCNSLERKSIASVPMQPFQWLLITPNLWTKKELCGLPYHFGMDKEQLTMVFRQQLGKILKKTLYSCKVTSWEKLRNTDSI